MALRELMDYGMISNATVQITRLTAPTPSSGKSRRPSEYDANTLSVGSHMSLAWLTRKK